MPGMSSYSEIETLNFWFRSNAGGVTPAPQVFVGLHQAPPGDDALPTELDTVGYTRKLVTFAAPVLDAASGHLIENTALLRWEAFGVALLLSHWSVWNAQTTGIMLWSDAFLPITVGATQPFEIPAGNLRLGVR